MEEKPAQQKGELLKGVVALVIIGAVFATCLSSGDDTPSRPVGGAVGGGTTRPAVQTPCARDIVYEVDGTAKSISITMENAGGNTEQATDLAVPLKLKNSSTPGLPIGRLPCGAFVYISAQNEGSSGTVTCRIRADGRVIEEATSSGGYTIATCSGTVT